MSLEKAKIHLSNSYYYQYGRFAGVEKDLDKSIEELRSALREIHKHVQSSTPRWKMMDEETNFPEPTFPKASVYEEMADLAGHPEDEVKDWFKRCMEEYPRVEISRYPNPGKTGNELLDGVSKINQWFDKWFSQFNEDTKGS